MAKLTLSFKGHWLSTYPIDDQPLVIGRDPDCGIRIDSLAIAPRHARISTNEHGVFVTALDAEHPVRVNMQPIEKPRRLEQGDVLQIGKHTLIFSTNDHDDANLPRMPKKSTPDATGAAADGNDRGTGEPLHAYLQVQSGAELGRILTFKRAVTRLTKLGASNVIVTRDDGTLNLSLSTNEGRTSIDGLDLEHGIEVPLHNGNMIEVNGVRCKVFCNI